MSKLFLLALIASLVYFFVRSLFKPIQKPSPIPRWKKAPGEPATEMVQDPVCKVFIDPNAARRIEQEGRNYYFCSEACEQKFLNQTRRGGVQ